VADTSRRWRNKLESFLLREWSGGGKAQLALRPLSWLYRLALALRGSLCVVSGQRPTGTAAAGLRAPLVVVGNLTVGGSGKTPCVMALAQALEARGWHPGVVSRGYGGRGRIEPVTAHSQADEVGDEPLLVARRTGRPVWVGPDRLAVARALLAAHPEVDVLLSDDGLQTLRLPRDVEIVVIDARRGLGNRRLLPAGPLREPAARLAHVDQVWLCGDGMTPLGLPPALVRIRLAVTPHAQSLARLGEHRSLSDFAGKDVTAVTGIAAPERFFAMLGAAGVDIRGEAWPDHHPFVAEDLAHLRDRTVLMTQKDAVKCESFAAADWWVVPLDAVIPDPALEAVERTLRRVAAHH
jgi:tetraacyldisaccharide 4'-kinase